MRKHFNFILLLIVLNVNLFFRMFPATLPFTREMARSKVATDMVKDAEKIIDSKYKDLPLASKLKAENDLLKIVEKENRISIEKSVNKKQKEERSYWQDNQGQTFLLEADPYHWLRLVKNLSDSGKISDKNINGVEYDSFMLAPIGMKASPSLHKNFHVYLASYIYKLAKVFNKNISLMQVVFYIPILISAIALLALFLFCLSFRSTQFNIVGLFSGIIFGLSPMFLTRSLGGWFDTDPYVILFSLLTVWAYYSSLGFSLSFKKRMFLASAGGLSLGLFSFTWDGWWYLFYLIIISSLFYILNLYLVNKESREKVNLNIPSSSLIFFIISTVFFVWIISGWPTVWHLVSDPAKTIFAKGHLQSKFWPNTFLTVSELKGENILGVINQIGGFLVLLTGCLALLLNLIDKKAKNFVQKEFITILFTFWIFILLYASLKAIRFSILLAVPFAVSAGIFCERSFEYLSNKMSRIKIIRKEKLIAFIILCLIFFPRPLGEGFLISWRAMPLINRGWWEVLNKIKEQTPKQAIINSWWDYGHWFKAIAERPVIFDGATQNTPMAYWMGRVFSADNEIEALGILRMLNSGSDKAFQELEKTGIDNYKCLEILNEIIVLKQKDAQIVLAKYISDGKKIKEVLSYTHNPRIAYFIVEPSLIYKMGPLSFLGEWDFKKADIYQRHRELRKEQFIDYLVKRYRYAKPDALKLNDTLAFISVEESLDWISPAYKYYGESKSLRKDGNLVFFDNGFVVDVVTHKAYSSDTRQRLWHIPKSIFYLEGVALKEVTLENSDSGYSILLLQEKENYKLVLLDAHLANSMLTRLYYLNGLGLKYFKPFITQDLKENEGKIIVYKIDWE